MNGHLPPEIGRVMEDEFARLLEQLGYRIYRKRDVSLGLDIIATFNGTPINPTPRNKCKLLRPIFSPKGITAFSLKHGDFSKTDIDDFLERINKARTFVQDKIIRSINGAVIVTNYTKTANKINKLLERNVYCWDIRRLIFYSVKARICHKFASNGPTREVRCKEDERISYLIETDRKIGSGAILINVAIFIDNHEKDFMFGRDHTLDILADVYEQAFKPIISSTGLDIQGKFEFHILGIANRELVETGYREFAEESSIHPRVVYTANPSIFQYGAAPWMPILRL